MKLQDNIYELRKKKGYSQEDLANACQVSRQSVSKWENGSAYPEIETIMQLADIFEVSVDYLLGREQIGKEVIVVPLRSEYEYISKWKIGNVPFIHIYHRNRYSRQKGKRKIAKGIIAIGDIAVGIVAIGMMSCGVLSLGFLSIGLFFSIGILSFGIYCFGTVAIGYFAFGIFAIGYYALGVVAIAYQVSAGVLAYGQVAVGVSPHGDVTYLLEKGIKGKECIVENMNASPYAIWLQSQQLPWFMKALLSAFTKC